MSAVPSDSVVLCDHVREKFPLKPPLIPIDLPMASAIPRVIVWLDPSVCRSSPLAANIVPPMLPAAFTKLPATGLISISPLPIIVVAFPTMFAAIRALIASSVAFIVLWDSLSDSLFETV